MWTTQILRVRVLRIPKVGYFQDFKQCCVFGSAWIRIDLAPLDPDPYWESGSGFGLRTKEIDQNLKINLISRFKKRLFYHHGMFYDVLPMCRWFRFAQLAKEKKFRP
jgi:hypothetical protein